MHYSVFRFVEINYFRGWTVDGLLKIHGMYVMYLI